MTLKITFVWIISFAVSAPLAIAGFVNYSNVYNVGVCVPRLKNFILYGSIFAFYVPLIIMVTTYTLTIRILKQNRVLMAGLQGKYHFPTAVGDRHRGGHRGNGLSKKESTRLSCPDLSPPRSDFTVTSVGMTSPKDSSAESAMSPGGERRGFNVRNKHKPRTQVFKVNMTDEANYVNYNFEQIFLKHMEDSKKEAEHHKKQSLSARLKSLSPKHSKSRTIRRGSQPNPTRSRIHADDPWNPPLLLFRISRYYSDSNLASLQSDYSHSVLDNSGSTFDEQRPNGTGRFVCQDQFKTRNGPVVPYAPLKDGRHLPTSLRLMSSSSDERYADFDSSSMCFHEGEMLKRKTPSCLTTQTTVDTSSGTSPLPVDGTPTPSVVGRYLDTSQMGRSWTLSTADGRGFEEKQRNGKGLDTNDVESFQEPTTKSHTTRQHPNGSAKKGSISKEDEEEEQDEVRGLLVTPSRRKGTPRPSMVTGSWSRGSPSINTSPSSSETRTILRERFNLGRSARKSPSACARKIGLLSKNRSNNERKASKVLGIIFAIFVLSWTPFFTVNIISVLCESCMEDLSESVMASIVWLGYLSSLANPIIYTMFSTSFRTVFYRILTCQYNHAVGCRRASRQSSEEGYLCWSKSGRNSSCLKDFGCESKKICGV